MANQECEFFGADRRVAVSGVRESLRINSCVLSTRDSESSKNIHSGSE